MAKASASAEPSMEEILASIRRIISDDGAAEASKPGAAAAPAVSVVPQDEPDAESHVTEDDLDRLFAQSGADDDDDQDSEVLDLDEAMTAEAAPDLIEGMMPDEADVTFAEASAPEVVDESEEVGWDDVEPAPAPPPPKQPAAAAPAEPPPADEEIDTEPLVSRSTGASVNAAFGQLTHTILSANAKTLDDLVKEMLRPMLKSWLDENLPSVVERLVRAEIERVSRGR
ncbi:MAG TPA: DUF2497 domain-containing protein [Methylomirabilota bacterium]|nr:DUF2497 domain-containing protein [Methylomirabilota bacterium]